MSDWSSDVCSSDLPQPLTRPQPEPETVAASAAPAAVMTRPAAPAPAPGPEPVLPRARLSDRIKVSPLAARIAEAKGIDLEGITGTGPNGRIVRADLGLPPVVAPAPAQTAGTGSSAPIVHDIPDVPHALEKLSNMRRNISRRRPESKQQVPPPLLTVDTHPDTPPATP